MKLFGIVILLGVIAALLVPQSPLYYKTLSGEAVTEVNALSEEVGDIAQQPSLTEDTTEETTESASSTSSNSQETSEETEIAAVSSSQQLTDRVLGDADAPLTIIEFSSLSCGHCGSFHSETYPELKKNYIETGKAKLIMIDFPLNLPALQGAKLAHCMPDEQYFGFLQLLFTTQQAWLSGDYLAKLKQNAQLAGLSAEEIQTCLDDEALEESIIARMEEAQAKWEVSSTPSFVINDGAEIIVGNKPYLEFAATLETILLQDTSSQQE